MLEKQHHQIPKQRSRRRAQQYPRADFGDFPNGALLLAAEQTVHNQCRYGAKEKNRKSLPIIPHSPKNIAFNQGRPSEASCTKQKRNVIIPLLPLHLEITNDNKCLSGHCNAPENPV